MGCLESVPRIKVEHFCSSCTVIIIVTEVARKLVNPLTHHMICVSPTNQLHLVQCAFVASTSSAQYNVCVQCSVLLHHAGSKDVHRGTGGCYGGRKAVRMLRR